MHETLNNLILLLTATVLLVGLARRLHLPPMLAYLAVGITVGPHGLAFIEEGEQVTHLAEFGIVFLMFSIGLEFSLARLKAMRRLVFGLGAAQVGVTLLGTIAVTVWYYGQDWRVGVAVGAACALSSTAIVSKMLSERLELHSQPGRQTMAVLLFQDLAVVPLLIAIPAIASETDGLAQSLAIAMAQAAIAMVVMIFAGQKIMRRWFDAVARQKSNELFMLNVFWVVIGLSWLTQVAGLSLALGAFIGGMLISETLYRHQVEADIRPFRDVLLGLFFVTIGMRLDLGYVLANLPDVILAVALLIGAKGGIVMILTTLLRNPLDISWRTAIQLAQAGEFGFVLIELAQHHHLLPNDVFQVTIAAMLLSMFIAPLLISRASHMGRKLSDSDFFNRAAEIQAVAAHSMDTRDHVILCGFGRTGQSLARFLERQHIPLIALDVDTKRIAQAQAAGENVVYGNADRREVLMAAGIERARAVVITYADIHSAEQALSAIRGLAPDLPIIVRAQDDTQIERLKAHGATEVVPEVLEGSLMLAAQTLAQIGVPVEQALQQVRQIRAERYAMLRSFYRGETDRLQRLALEKLVLHIEANAWARGRTIADLGLAGLEIHLEALRRQGERLAPPAPETLIELDDVLILTGPVAALSAAERRIFTGE